jgi:D-alanine transaminase
MTRISFVNGKFLPHDQCFVHIEDRGLQFADGVYEVILFKNKQFVDLARHLTRLLRSLNEMHIKIEQSKEEITQILQDLLQKNNIADGAIYLQVNRGAAPRAQGLPDCTASIIATVKNLAIGGQNLRTIFVEDIRWGRCDIKSIALFAGCLAKQTAVEKGADDAIFVKNGAVQEGSFANIFMVDDEGILTTPGTKQNILGGITRRRILQLAQKNNIKTAERPINQDEILQAKEVFFTSSSLLIRPVVQIEEDIIGGGKVGPLTQKLQKIYNNFIDEETNKKI